MTKDELEIYYAATLPKKMIGPLIGQADQTLLYGYDVDRLTWHVYQKGGLLHRAIYRDSTPESTREPEAFDEGEQLDAENLVPNKRLYPEACNLEFCLKLRALEIYLSFTTYGTLTRSPGATFFGRTF